MTRLPNFIEIANDSEFDASEELFGRIAETAKLVLAHFRLDEGFELSIIMVDLAEMERLHIEYMDEPGATDVLSFPMDDVRAPADGEIAPPGILGDVVLCPEFAKAQAETAGNSLEAELEMLLVHGILHLLGHDHAEPEEHAVMFGLQGELLNKLAEQRA